MRALRAMPRRRRTPVWIEEATARELSDADLVGRDPQSYFQTTFQRPCAVAQARADEIVQAWDKWQAEFTALEEAHGIPAAEGAVDAAIEARLECANKIAEARATTLDGFRISGKIVADIYEGDLSGDEDDPTTSRGLMWRRCAIWQRFRSKAAASAAASTA